MSVNSDNRSPGLFHYRLLSYYFAGVAGIEPTSTVLETGMLPLHQTPEPLRRIELLSFGYESNIISHYTKEASNNIYKLKITSLLLAQVP